MKRNAAALFLAALMFLPIVAASILVFEQFEDDTPGANPSGSGYSYTEGLASSAVTSAQASSGSNSFLTAYGSASAFQRTSGEFCTSGERAQFKFLLTSWPTGPSEQVGFGLSYTNPVSETGNGQVGRSAVGRNSVHLTITDQELATFVARKNNNEFNSNSLTFTGINLNTWYDVDLQQTSCATTSGSITISGGDLAAPISTSASTGSAPLGSWTYFGVGTTSADGGNLYIDDLCIGSAACVGAFVPDPPTGVAGDVAKTGSASTTGRVDLEWTLSPDDPDQDVGSYDYHIYVNGSFYATDTVTAADGGGVRTGAFYFTGSPTFGDRVITIVADNGVDSDPSCSITLDVDDLGAADTCGVEIEVEVFPAEFDVGLEAAIESWGFITAESKFFFVLILAGGAVVATSVLAKWLPSGRLKNYLYLGVQSGVVIFAAYLAFITEWELIVALVIALFIVRGTSEAVNSYHSIRARVDEEAARQDVQMGDLVDFLPDEEGFR